MPGIRWFDCPLLLAAHGLSACSMEGFFYQPNREVLSTPESIGGDVEVVHFAAPGGPRLHGWWLEARPPARGTVVFCHGNYGNLTHHVRAVRWMPERGYNLLIFDYRGYGESEGEVTRAGTITDTLAAVDWALQRDPERTILFGHSLGGAIAVAAAAERPRVRAVIAASTFATYRGMAAAKAPYVGWLVWMAVSNAFDPVKALPAIAPRPLLVIHGTADQVVPFALGRELFDQAASPKRFVEVPGGDHGLPPGGDPQEFAAMIDAFIEDGLSRERVSRTPAARSDGRLR